MTRPALVLVPQHFGSLVFDRRTSRYLPFDHETTALFRRAAAVGTFAAIEEEEDAARRALVADLFAHFEAEGFFLPDGRFAGEVRAPHAAPPVDHLLGPLALHLEVIAACNLRCTHCFAGALPRKADLSLAEIDRLFAELAALGTFRIGLTGGEPLLRKDLFAIVDAALAHGLHPCLTTNGLLVDEAVARSFSERAMAWVNVSLDGATAATNDAVRGAGTFDEVTRRLRAYGRHFRFTLAFTITSENAGEVVACAELARELGASNAVFRPLYPVGVARSRPDLMPTFEEYTRALDELARLGHDVHAIDTFAPSARADAQAKTFSPPGCGAANLVASVSATGDVNPCSFLGAAFESGNLRARSFSEIWRAGHAFRRLRAAQPGPDRFFTGCRARSLAAYGDVDAPDPWDRTRARPPLATMHLPVLR
ncbi:MAG: radical SAM protein [Labilithrix sp.]|nr:radical SAM protein [Labilithrix sp.]MCW5813298.1 radical SAM protein [Labilithrix sp.]